MLRQIFSYLLLLFFLFSQVGLTSAKHFCGDFLAASTVGLLAEASSCGMETGTASCGENSTSDSEDSCCHDEVEHLKADTESVKTNVAHLHFPAVASFTAPVFWIAPDRLLFPVQSAPVLAFSHSPPYNLSSLRLLAFLQIFLI